MEKISGIYKIRSISKPNRVYIGSSNNLRKRKRAHFALLKNGQHHSIKLQRHYNKYGKEDLVLELIESCDEEDLLAKEQYFIDVYNPWFNILPSAGSNRGFSYSDEYKQKMSEILKGRIPWNKGKKMPPEWGERAANRQRGHPSGNSGKRGRCKHTAEHKEMMSKKLKNRKYSEETLAKMHSPENMAKQSVVAKLVNHRRWHGDTPYETCPICHKDEKQVA